MRKEFEHHVDACKRGFPGDCVRAGHSAHGGFGTDKSDSYALELFARACVKGGSHAGCSGLVMIGMTNDKNPPLATRAIDTACAANDYRACNWKASTLRKSDPGRAHALDLATCLAADSVDDNMSDQDLDAIASACTSIATDLAKHGDVASRVAAVKLGLIGSELQLESAEKRWAASDHAALEQQKYQEWLAEEQKRIAEERAARAHRWEVIAGAVSAGIESVQPLISQQLDIYHSNQVVMAQARQWQASRNRPHYVPPPPPPNTTSVAASLGSQPATPTPTGGSTALQQCLAEPVTETHVTQTNPFTALVTHYEDLLRRAERCPVDATNNGDVGHAKWEACMKPALWREQERINLMKDFERRISQVKRAPGSSPCITINVDVERYCSTMSRDNCIGELKDTVMRLRQCDAGAQPLFDAEDARNNAETKKRHDDACHRRYP